MQRLEAADLGRVVCFSEQDRVQQESLYCIGFPDDDDDEDIPHDIYWRLRDEHPVCHYQGVTGDFRAFKWTDFVSKRELRRREIYAELFKATGTEYQLVVGLDAPFWHTKVFTFNRGGGRDFGERERDVLDVLRPSLAQL